MAETGQNAFVFAGDHKLIKVVLQNEMNPEGLGVTYKVAKSVGAPAMLEKTLDNGITIDSSGDKLIFVVTMAPADTAELCSAKYYHEMEITTADSKPYTIMTGALTIKPTLIRP